jgi:transcriptional regulator with XRE-family HTH domain
MKIPIGSRIREWRETLQLSLNQLAKELGTTPASLSIIENGKRTPRIELLIKFAKYFHQTTDYLLGLTSSNDEYYLQVIQDARKTGNMEEFNSALQAIREEMFDNKVAEDVLRSLPVLDSRQVESRAEFLSHFLKVCPYPLLKRLVKLPVPRLKRVIALLENQVDFEENDMKEKRKYHVPHKRKPKIAVIEDNEPEPTLFNGIIKQEEVK